MGDNKNFILFAVLSLAFFMGYEYFVLGPKMQKAQEAQQAQIAQEAKTGETAKAAGDKIAPPESGVPSSAPAQKAPVLENVGQVTVDTPELKGSINLRGATFDDIILNNFTTSLDKDSKKVRLLSSENKPDGYYARFGWVAPAGTPAGALPTDMSVWTADHDTLTPDQPVTLAWDNGQGTRFLMKVSVDDKFMFTVDQSVINTSGAAMKVAPYGIITRKGEPKTSGLYILHEGPMSVFDGIYEEKTYKNLTKDGDFETKGTDGTGGWIGITDKYWMATLVPDPKAKVARARMERNTNSAGQISYDVNFVQNWTDVPAGQTVETTNHLYAGAKIVKVIDAYKAKYGITDFDKAVDWGYFWFFTKPIFHGLHWLFQITGNYGVAIILMTMILKLLLFPLASKSYRSMSHMKRAQPKIKAIQERYKDDKARQQQEMMALYKAEKINPAAGCLPMIPQTFVFFALYKTLYVTIEMRHQPFFGWIHDLSAADHLTIVNLFGLIPWTPPTAIAIGVLPMLMGFTMWLQQKMNPQSAQMDPTQAKVMQFLPLVFTFIMARFSAGLVLYWTCNNTLSILQQWVIMRREDARLAGLSKTSS
ncbi:membrane protein insertase YidC [Kordiimonas marina]|uniref:membrane protein insertase YidC n=1 Tax=Kordiimonas marina TaxID=2872312 RepID=UPI001FF3820A|nr:membrane protein insertase YidC [Kordiimonas marina]MCJ9428219.1 membrane protein insertase YidC [Kordiimonas marina]